MRSYSFTLVVKTCIWIILSVIAGITATISQGPSNTVTEIGNQVELNCTADAPIDYWTLSRNGDANGELTIVGPGCSTVNAPFDDHYSVESIGGGATCNLIIFNITLEQAGVYRCLEAQNNMFSILTVIDFPPAITVNSTEAVLNNEKVVIACSLNYNGSVEPAPTLRPYFYWTNTYGENVNNTYNSTTENTAVSQLTVTAQGNDIMPYTCHVFLQLIPSTDPSCANNTPPVDSSATSPIIEVLFGPGNINFAYDSRLIWIDGTSCEVKYVNCISHGSPLPSFEWFDTKDNVSISNESILDLAEISRNYTCVAYNTIRNEVHRNSRSFIPTGYLDPPDCRFPHDESTWTNVTFVEGCDNGTCACSEEYDYLILTCNANTYPPASYKWTGADNTVINSQVLTDVTTNGVYYCTAYIDPMSSNYTGTSRFSSGSSSENVTECTLSQTAPSTTTTSDMSSEMTTMGAISGPGLTTPQPDGVTTDAYVPPEPCTRSTAVYVNFEPEVDTHGVQISSRIIRRGSPKCIVVCQKQCSASIAKCTDRPCRNNGTCVDISTGYRCECPLGFTGTNCEQELDCDGVTCVQGLASYGG